MKLIVVGHLKQKAIMNVFKFITMRRIRINLESNGRQQPSK